MMSSAVAGILGALVVATLMFAVCALVYAEGERNQRDYHDPIDKP